MSDPDQPTAETPAWWSFERFMNDEARDRRCPNVIDVTGRARYLFFGPFINLPAGHWRATVFLELCPDAARRRLAVQFGSEPDYTTEGVPGGRAGAIIFAE